MKSIGPKENSCAAIILAAGLGSRMKSVKPKVLHPLCGQPMVTYAVKALKLAGIDRIVMVVPTTSKSAIKSLFGTGIEYVVQHTPLGTGHAVSQATRLLKHHSGTIVVAGGDTPLIPYDNIEELIKLHQARTATITILTAHSTAGNGLGEITRDFSGNIVDIVEATQSNVPDGRQVETNVGLYAFDPSWLWSALPRIPLSPTKEYFLTSLISMANQETRNIGNIVLEDPQLAIGINTRVQLAEVEATMRSQIRSRWMRDGVTILDPQSTFIDETVILSPDTTIYPNTMIFGHSNIGGNCQIGPNTVITESTIGKECIITASYLDNAKLGDRISVGPFSHLRPGAHLESDVHIGNFSEIKNSHIESGTSMGHFGYIGDASIGKSVNLGAGTVTCNFDGSKKHPTTVEDDVLIGSATMLVAPVRIGQKARTGAGSVITKDIPAGRLAVGVPATIKDSKTKKVKTSGQQKA